MRRSALVVFAWCTQAAFARAASPEVSRTVAKSPPPTNPSGTSSGAASSSSAKAAALSDPPAVVRHIALGAGIGVVARTANADKVSFRPGFAFGVQADLPIFSWLTLSTYYLYAKQSLKLDGSAPVGTNAPVSIVGSLSTYELGARIEPTWVFDARTRAWVSVGAAWGVLGYPTLTLNEADPYRLTTPDHPFVLIPLGVGADYEIIPNWLSVRANTAFGVTVFDQSIPRVQSLRQSGAVVSNSGLPGFTNSFSALVGAVLHL